MSRPIDEVLRVEDLTLRGTWRVAFLLAGLALGAGIVIEAIAGFWAAVGSYGAIMVVGFFAEVKHLSRVRKELLRTKGAASQQTLAQIQGKLRSSHARFILRFLPVSITMVYLLLASAIAEVWNYPSLREGILLFAVLLVPLFALLFLWARAPAKSLGRREA